MRKGGIPGLIIVLMMVGSSGCGLMEPVRPLARYAKSLTTMRPRDYNDPTEEEVDYWITDAGDEAAELRGRSRERDPDQWWKKYVMSEKARSIERNVGID